MRGGGVRAGEEEVLADEGGGCVRAGEGGGVS